MGYLTMSKATAKREIDRILSQYKPWDVIPDDVQDEIHNLAAIAYPDGIPLPRL